MRAKLKLQQVGEQVPPLIRIAQTDPACPFTEGEGRVYIYHAGTTSLGEIVQIVRDHTLGGTVILDRSTEALNPNELSTERLLAAIPDGCRIVVLCQNHDYVRAARALGDDRLTGVFFHSFLHTLHTMHRRTDLAALIERRRPDGPPQRLYSCLLNRPRSGKIVIFGWLKQRGYLEAGNVSFRGDPVKRDSGAMDKLIAETRADFSSFSSEIDTALAAEWPYANFEEGKRENYLYSVDVPAYDAPVSLVAETEMKNNFERFTEKSLKSFIAGHRTLIAGNAGVARLLKDIGFAFPGFSSHYDGIIDHEARLRSLLAEFDRYMRMPAAERLDFLDETWAACRDNMERYIPRLGAVIDRGYREIEAACERSRWSAPPLEADVPVPWTRAARPAA